WRRDWSERHNGSGTVILVARDCREIDDVNAKNARAVGARSDIANFSDPSTIPGSCDDGSAIIAFVNNKIGVVVRGCLLNSHFHAFARPVTGWIDRQGEGVAGDAFDAVRLAGDVACASGRSYPGDSGSRGRGNRP